MARRYQANGTPVAGEFQVNTRVLGYQYQPDPAYFSDGSAIIVWTSYNQDGSNGGVYGQRLDASGAKLGPEFNINSFTTGFQGRPSVAVAPDDSFGVIWQSDLQDGDNLGVFAQQFDAEPASGWVSSFRSTTSRPVSRARRTSRPSRTASTSRSGTARSTATQAASPRGSPGSRRSGRCWSTCLTTPSAEGGANLNGVLEPDEAASVEPSFTNHSDDSLPLSGTASNFRGLPGPTVHADRHVGRLRHDHLRRDVRLLPVDRQLLFGDGLRHAPRPSTGMRHSTRRSRTRASPARRACTSARVSPTCP